MTDMEEKAQRYEKRQRGIELKKRLATLGDRLQDHANEWNKLGKLFSEYAHPDITFAVEPDQFGLREFRVRHEVGDLARIEVPLDALPRLIAEPARKTIADKLHSLGFKYVSLDLDGFRSGSMNAVVPLENLIASRRPESV